ncbi:MAG TPA: TOBE-like domain-containing protein [Micropepsaceae bacterium]|nr:TOBE-like domain-containing protein [Micropepsaceae bacterium]
MQPASPPAEGIDGAETALVVEELEKRFDTQAAVNGIDLAIPRRTFLALLGPSGSGKTTLLRILGGLEQPDAGAVKFEGQDWLGIPARERRVGFVFQNYALFRHMTVARNIAFGLKVRPRAKRPSRREISRRVEELLALVQLEGLADRYPAQLSGGQRQRVALARALAIEPKLLLLDEPFGALDAKVRKDLRRWLRGLHERLELTTIFVTHDQEEALDLADQVAVMNEGRIEQMGTPQEIYSHPQTAFVAEFLGGSNKLEGHVVNGSFVVDGVTLPLNGIAPAEGEAIALVRPHEFAPANADEPAITVTVSNVLAAGALLRLDCLRRNGETLEVALPGDAALPSPGNPLRLKLLTQRLYPRPNTR